VGSYQVIYTISGSCGDADTAIVVVNVAANATINAAGPYCVSDNAVTLTAAQTGGTWSGTGITNISTGAFDPGTAGVGSHVITYIISGACADTGTITIIVNSLVNATITPAGPYCLNNIPVTLTAATSGGVWTGGGITNASSGLFNPSIAGVGPHTIIYTISGNCGNADTISITVYDIPEGSATATGETCIGANDGTGSISVSGGLSPYTYSWSGGQTTQSVSNLPPDIYTVTIIDAHGCAITDTAEVIASTTPCETYIPHIYVPNIFSPNGDGQNDVLYVRGKGVKELEFVIYDRWGEKVFESTDLNKGWDGRYKNKDMDAAVFVYYLKATLDNDEKVDVKGNITLVR
jgi:gliding motility-associated-like protein